MLDLFQLSTTEEKKDMEYKDTDIAIVGVSIHLPMIDSIDDLYEVLKRKIECIGYIPENRAEDVKEYLKSKGIHDFAFRKAGYLEHIDLFNAEFFRITPYEATLMNPNQRMALMSMYESIEDAGYGGRELDNSNTGIYMGYIELDSYKYKESIFEQYSLDDVNVSIIGNLNSMIPARISYYLNLKGPSCLVDTACSSSLTALHQACRAIQVGDCEQAIVSAAQMTIFPYENGIELGMESEDDCIHAFDDAAAGTVRGEGIISLFIKPVKKALQDKDFIYGIIKGSAINHDGTTMGITAPNADAQCEVLLSAWKESGIHPESIDCIEAHGTGTKIGDAIEMEGLTKAFRKYTDKKQFCAISSVKSNLGHLFDASGLLGVAKCLAELKYQKLLPGTNFRVPNRKIQFEDTPLYVCDKEKDWVTEGKKRLCGISSFGFSGTNCHVILEEGTKLEKSQPRNYNILALSASDKNLLLELISGYQRYIKTVPDEYLTYMCYTVNNFRTSEKERIVFIFHTKEELKNTIVSILETGVAETRTYNCSNEMIKEQCYIDEFLAGGKVNWMDIYEEADKVKIPAPLTPRKKERYWPEFKKIVHAHDSKNGQSEEEIRINKQPTDEIVCGNRLPGHVEYEVVLGNIKNVVEKLLRIEELSVTENLFGMSIDSILLVRIQKEIDQIYPDVLALSKMFVYPSIAELAQYVTEEWNKKVESGTIKQTSDVEDAIQAFLDRDDDLVEHMSKKESTSDLSFEDMDLSVEELLDKISHL